ncbi:YajG family lipoprotein [Endozoicomonas arenosclerae]|uniref:YajG family lipoprotein n=1 Tax=Endozoicomonas arenosclerae TaxID=1633495 RepID=UPI00078601C7|nr:YajG family lipoprotein [Endozoicomonas arenosclerae]
MKKASVILLGALALGGCALSPQEVGVNPRVAVEKPVKQLQGTVSVTVYDERLSRSLGSRGGVYSSTNAITTNDRLTLAVRSAVELGLRELGLRVTESEEVPQFQVYLDDLEYQVPEGSYITQVDLKSKIRVRILNNGQRFEGTYSSEMTERVPKAPSDEKNEELIDKVLSDVLSRALADPRLLDFFKQE